MSADAAVSWPYVVLLLGILVAIPLALLALLDRGAVRTLLAKRFQRRP